MLQHTSNVFAEARRVLASALGTQARRGLVSGTWVETPEGRRPVEALQVGDLVTGHDGRPRALVRVARTGLTDRAAQEALRQAVLVAEGHLGTGAALTVLAGQVLLLHVPRGRALLGADFALLPPKALAGQKGVTQAPPAGQLEIIELASAEETALWLGPSLLAHCPAADAGPQPAPRYPVLDQRGAAALLRLLARPAAPSPFRAQDVRLPRRVTPTAMRAGRRRGQAAAGEAPKRP